MKSGFNLDNIFTNSWGNKKMCKTILEDATWTRVGIYKDMKNNKTFPLQVWAFSKKKLMEKNKKLIL